MQILKVELDGHIACIKFVFGDNMHERTDASITWGVKFITKPSYGRQRQVLAMLAAHTIKLAVSFPRDRPSSSSRYYSCSSLFTDRQQHLWMRRFRFAQSSQRLSSHSNCILRPINGACLRVEYRTAAQTKCSNTISTTYTNRHNQRPWHAR